MMYAHIRPLKATKENKKLYKEIAGKRAIVKKGFILNAYEVINDKNEIP